MTTEPQLDVTAMSRVQLRDFIRSQVNWHGTEEPTPDEEQAPDERSQPEARQALTLVEAS